MKKTEIILLISTCLFNASAFSMDNDEPKAAKMLKAKPLKKQGKLSAGNAPGWYGANSRIKIRYTQAREIGDFKGSTLYGYIDPAFSNPQWQIALDKGFTKTAKGTNGVKFLKDNLLELKINGNERLYALEVHKNDQGDYIAIFDRQTCHKQIKKLANKNKLKIYSDCLSSEKNNSGDNAACIRSNKAQKLQKINKKS